MHNELRYQAKTHAISEKLSKEKIMFHIFSSIYFFVENQYTEKQQRHAYGKGNDI
jgi:hypothetical protein